MTSCPAGGLGGTVLQHFRDRLPGDGQRIAVEHAVVEEHLHHLGHAAGPVEFRRHESSGRLQIAEDGHAVAGCVQNRRSSAERPRHARWQGGGGRRSWIRRWP